MDRVREAIMTAAADLGEDFGDISERIGVERPYLRRYLEHGVPADLPAQVSLRLARELGLPAGILRPAGGAPFTAGYSNAVPRPALRVIEGGAHAEDTGHRHQGGRPAHRFATS